MNTNKRATIKQVAKAAGFPRKPYPGLSMIVQNVSTETRERIQRVIAEMDYRPSALARSLISQRSYTLGVVTAGLKYFGPSRTLNGITSMAGNKYDLCWRNSPISTRKTSSRSYRIYSPITWMELFGPCPGGR